MPGAIAKATWDAAVKLAGERNCRVTAELVRIVYRRLDCAGSLKPIQLSSSSLEWTTPSCFVYLARQVLGGIDFDPCSNGISQRTIQALQYFGKEDNGLQQSWHGRVFVNPPFGTLGCNSQQGLFLSKAIAEYEAGRACEVILLLKVAIGYAWFQQALQHPHAFMKDKVSFIPDHERHTTEMLSGNPHGSVVVYLGHNIDLFCEVFTTVALIPGQNCWSR